MDERKNLKNKSPVKKNRENQTNLNIVINPDSSIRTLFKMTVNILLQTEKSTYR